MNSIQTVGILGGGQLAMMLAKAGLQLGLKFIFLEPNENPCVKTSLGKIIQKSFEDPSGIKEFVSLSDVITFENEFISPKTIELIYSNGPALLRPSPKALSICSDRLFEKTLFQTLNIPTNQFEEFNSDSIQRWKPPYIIKARRGGYDGKSQYRINHYQNLNSLSDLSNLTDLKDAIIEQQVQFEREISIIGARNSKGEFSFYDICENIHHEGILHQTKNKINDPHFKEASYYLKKIMNHFNYIGVLTIEFFVVNNQLIANEIAPRVHNSGHWTIEGCECSQFESHLRAICDLPFRKTQSIHQCKMTNIIGHWPKNINESDKLFVHNYKKETRHNRKLGHLNQI